MFSMKTVYGLKALHYLASKDPQSHTLISEIAKEEQIPKKFLEAILLALKNDGILSSRIGKGGGYQLAKPAANITMKDIIRSLEGTLEVIPCGASEGSPKCEICTDKALCGVSLVSAQLTDQLNSALSAVTLEDMIRMASEAYERSREIINYSI